MALISNKNDTIDEYEELDNNENEELLAVLRKDKNTISMKKSLVFSSLLHPTFILFVSLITLLITWMGLNFGLFQKPKNEIKDIEFVLVDKEAPPIDKNTKNRAEKNSRAGGIHDPKKAVSLPSTPSQKSAPQKPQAQATKKTVQKQQQTPKKVTTPVKQQSSTPKVVKQQASQPKKTTTNTQPAPARPVIKPPSANQSSMRIPVTPTQKSTTSKQQSSFEEIFKATGPVSTSKGSGLPGSSNAGSKPSSGKSYSSGGSGRAGSPYSTGGGLGNPSPGNPRGANGIDAIKEPDFGPYMSELERRIKRNWTPPKDNESKRVVLYFQISRDGRLLSLKVARSSGVAAADKAALSAVQSSAPFKPLPAGTKNNSVDIQFTFDYNVMGGSASRY